MKTLKYTSLRIVNIKRCIIQTKKVLLRAARGITCLVGWGGGPCPGGYLVLSWGLEGAWDQTGVPPNGPRTRIWEGTENLTGVPSPHGEQTENITFPTLRMWVAKNHHFLSWYVQTRKSFCVKMQKAYCPCYAPSMACSAGGGYPVLVLAGGGRRGRGYVCRDPGRRAGGGEGYPCPGPGQGYFSPGRGRGGVRGYPWHGPGWGRGRRREVPQSGLRKGPGTRDQ